jgi:hypothetical protein
MVLAIPVCTLREVKFNRTPLGNPLDELTNCCFGSGVFARARPLDEGYGFAL